MEHGGDQLVCDDTPVNTCIDGDCDPCHGAPSLTCTPADLATADAALQSLEQQLLATSVYGLSYPNTLCRLRFCNGKTRYLFREELPLAQGLAYEVLQRVPVADLQSIFRVTYLIAITKFASVSELMGHRLNGVRIDAVSELNETIPDTGGAGPGGGGGGGSDPAAGDLQISYYLYDHAVRRSL